MCERVINLTNNDDMRDFLREELSPRNYYILTDGETHITAIPRKSTRNRFPVRYVERGDYRRIQELVKLAEELGYKIYHGYTTAGPG